MTEPPVEQRDTQCCIVGGGPAGVMLGFLLARAGVDVVVLEKHGDFLRDFRGDTIHPSTLTLMAELGLLASFRERPHQEVRHLTACVGDHAFPVADFTHVPGACQFLVFMPQWDFLDFLAEQARAFPTFRLCLNTEATDLLFAEDGTVVGVRAKTQAGPVEIRAGLTIGADGRRSLVRTRAELPVKNLGAPMDVLWMRVSRKQTDPDQVLGRFDRGQILILIDRGDYWQCGLVILKGTFDSVRARGLDAFHADLTRIAPLLGDRVNELDDWDKIKLLNVAVDRLSHWCRPGLLCIGDSAHAMSPVGGVGINLAIQDAVAAANILAGPLAQGSVSLADLQRVQRRRLFPTRMTQRLQVLIQNRLIGRVLASDDALRPAWVLSLLERFPILQRIPARIIGVGFRPEHVRSPAARP